MPPFVDYLWDKTLEQIIGAHSVSGQVMPTADAIAIVSMPSAHTHEELVVALDVVEAILCPFPALAIHPWFWDTPPGLIVALAQWAAYGPEREVLNPSQVCLALWGQVNASRLGQVNRLIERRILHPYYKPAPGSRITNRKGALRQGTRPYFRRDQVKSVLDMGTHQLKTWRKQP
jgi:hypothetical protein